MNSILFTTHEIHEESPSKTQLFCFTEKFDVHLEVELAQASFSLARAGRQEQEHESGWEFFWGQFWSNWVNLGYSDLIWVKIGHNAMNVQSVSNCVQNWFKPGNIDEGRDRMLSNIHI